VIDRQLAGTKFPDYNIGVERSQIRLFAKAIGETDPRYLDVYAARGQGHPDLLAPPTFVVGLAATENTDAMAAIFKAGGDLRRLLHGEQAVNYFRDAHAGDELRCTARIGQVYDKRNGELEFVELQTDVTDAANGQRVVSMTSVLVFNNRQV
jgi:hydroxyacyl-ACP dehydratase HTD2-like protein with hotdog domain